MKHVLTIALCLCGLTLTTTPSHAKSALPNDTQLTELLGAAGWHLPAFSGLRKGMSYEQLKKRFPKASKLSKHGFVKVKVKGVPGVSKYEFYFRKDKTTNVPRFLHRATIIFKKKLTRNDAFFMDLVNRLERKWGKLKKRSRADRIARKILTWTKRVRRSIRVGQLAKIGKHLQLRVDL